MYVHYACLTHNRGSDHPAMLEAMIKAKQDITENSSKFPTIITCPSELVALSAALGYAQVTGIPQCVIVHVDCGTLAMGQSIHNASVGRVPVLCFAGLSPFTQNGELLGSRTKFIHWLQDVPDQAAILRQYCRYSGEIKTGRNIKEMVYRALHFAMSDSKGPVYLTAAREVLEEAIPWGGDTQSNCSQRIARIRSDVLCKALFGLLLTASEVELIGSTLINAKKPLVIAGYLGRNPQAPPLLAELCDKLPISVLESVGSDMSMRTDHEAYLGVTITTHPAVCEADVILILDCDVPWIPTAGKPQKGRRLAPKLSTTVFHLDVDPLKQQMPLFSINATRRLKVSCEIALRQLNAYIDKQGIEKTNYATAFEARANRYLRRKENLRALESPSQDGAIRVPYLASRLRHHLPEDTVYLVEAVSNAGLIIQHLNLTQVFYLPDYPIPVNTALARNTRRKRRRWPRVGRRSGIRCQAGQARRIHLCNVSIDDHTVIAISVYWIARRYDLPFLLVVLNNGGWNAPKVSALLVHQDGLSSKSNRREYGLDLNISFEPSPDYPGIATAAGTAWGITVKEQEKLDSAIQEAANVVRGGKCAVIEVS
ncbi:thiamine pyrophosphate-requiring enzyme [Aspergillus oryzae 100-8]|uniref:Thiamine pyrophosphate-requiring enzyme n=1 Tax=Aspergillus oryzae (strain 3.042) TaxID=1160506 RepID=I8TFW0_ASPO3|nr:thiamine pyrophosphate-requiring enzyme [Aspergillus oryzae 3.042]KDE77227.1 thiamine pyrophosphate-requiring enzyme [Aspergillus oryzae 100-8]|eukprot:EIT72910.1 thiamine pyrophosphate-requiring enzyme [Aspergillus oryzae 3.042]